MSRMDPFEWQWVHILGTKRGKRHLVKSVGPMWAFDPAACGIGASAGWNHGGLRFPRCKNCIRALERMKGGRP